MNAFLSQTLDVLKSIVIKYASTILVVLTIIGLGYFGYTMWRGKQELEVKYANLVGIQEKYEQLTKYTAKLENDYKSQKDLQEEAAKRWGQQANQLKGQIKMLSDATFLMRSYARQNNMPDLVYEGKTPETSYVYYEIEYRDKDGKSGPPVGYVMIYKSGKIVSKVYDYSILVNLAVSQDRDSGKYTVLSKADWYIESGHLGTRQGDRKIPGKEDWRLKPYPLPIVGGKALIDPTEETHTSQFYWYAPHLNGGLNVGVENGELFARPSVSFNVAGYGKTKNDLKWKFLQPGVGFSPKLKTFDINLMPFSYRPFDTVITNTYIGPGISFSHEGPGYFLGISLGF